MGILRRPSQIYTDPSLVQLAGCKSFNEFLTSEYWRDAYEGAKRKGLFVGDYRPQTIKNAMQGARVYHIIQQKLPGKDAKGTFITLSVAKALHPLLRLKDGADELAKVYGQLLEEVGGVPNLVTVKRATEAKQEALKAAGKLTAAESEEGEGASALATKGKPCPNVDAVLQAFGKSGLASDTMSLDMKANLLVGTLFSLGAPPKRIEALVKSMAGDPLPPEFKAPLSRALEELEALVAAGPSCTIEEVDDAGPSTSAAAAVHFLTYPGVSPGKRKRAELEQEEEQQQEDSGGAPLPLQAEPGDSQPPDPAEQRRHKRRKKRRSSGGEKRRRKLWFSKLEEHSAITTNDEVKQAVLRAFDPAGYSDQTGLALQLKQLSKKQLQKACRALDIDKPEPGDKKQCRAAIVNAFASE